MPNYKFGPNEEKSKTSIDKALQAFTSFNYLNAYTHFLSALNNLSSEKDNAEMISFIHSELASIEELRGQYKCAQASYELAIKLLINPNDTF